MEEAYDEFLEQEIQYIIDETGFDRETIEEILSADNEFLSDYAEKNNIEVEEV